MKITICSSIDFAPKIIEIKKELESRGHEVKIPLYSQKILEGDIEYEEYVNTKEKEGDMVFRKSSDIDLISEHWNKIKHSDAILVLNMAKKGIDNYIGGNTLIEMGFAFGFGKKIFLYNPIPERSERIHYVDEIKDMNPIVINRDMDKLK